MNDYKEIMLSSKQKGTISVEILQADSQKDLS